MDATRRREILRGLAARSDLDAFSDGILDSYWGRPELRDWRPPRDRARRWTRWHVDMVLRWLIEGQPPSEAELDILRDRARSIVEGGTPVDSVPASFRRGARFGWSAALALANEEEREAVLECADLLFEFVDRVSSIFADAYEHAERGSPDWADERLARALMTRLAENEPPLSAQLRLVARIGYTLGGVCRPFAIGLAEPAVPRSLELAARLRRRGILAACAGPRVEGLANHPIVAADLGLPAGAVIAEGELTGREEVGRALAELRTVVAIARRHGHLGRVSADDYLPELLLAAAPRIAARIRSRVYGPLSNPELAQTLVAYTEHNFSRQRTALALPVHRNTLRERLARVGELTGLDLDSADDRGLAWLAGLSVDAADEQASPGAAVHARRG